MFSLLVFGKFESKSFAWQFTALDHNVNQKQSNSLVPEIEGGEKDDKCRSHRKEIERFTPTELAEFRRWYANFDADDWDEQIEADAASGKLDALVEYEAGKAREI